MAVKLRSEIVINAPPEVIWPWVADPARVMRWNEKLVRSDAPGIASLGEGVEYWLTYRMARESRVRATITEWAPPDVLEVRFEGGDLGREGWARERTELRRQERGTAVTRVVRFHDPRIPLPARLLMRLIGHVGKPRERTMLQTIKELVEGEGHDGA